MFILLYSLLLVRDEFIIIYHLYKTSHVSTGGFIAWFAYVEYTFLP